jgi:hypothetical protein
MGDELPKVPDDDHPALTFLMRECRRHPSLAVALRDVSWLSEAIAGWLVSDDSGNPFQRSPITVPRAAVVVGEVLRRTSLDAMPEATHA